ncbi:hypothetical protein ACQEVB_17915 [Pseudonocardia sp. CA-107938]|uniref:hypothetical protein n=1 Tax=Pseudonocardia sp. CA-107938 TaxID=3240021 RepID=UPI003D918584
MELPDPGVVAEEWWLAGPDGPDRPGAFLVDEVRRDERGDLLLRVPAGLPADVRSVWSSVTRPVDALLAGLQRSDDAPLAGALARQQLAGRPDPTIPHPVGLSAEQAEAYRACRTPGLRLVWGPAGPRTSAVVARAAADLVRAGRRVLLLGATDAGVDATVAALVAGLEPEDGEVVRVGPTRGVDADGVSLDRLAARETAVDDRRRAVVGHQLATFAGQDPEIAALAAELVGYDDDAYQRAARRVAAAEEAAELEPRRRAALAVMRTAATRHSLAIAARAAILRERDELAEARMALARIEVLEEELRRLDRDLRRHRTEQAVARHWAWRGADGWLDRRRRRREAKLADRDLAKAERDAGPRRSAVQWELLQARAAAGRITAADLAAVDARLVNAHADVLAAATQLVRAEVYAEELSARAEAVRTRGEPTDEDRELVAAALSEGLPGRYERLLRLRRRRPTSAAARGRLGAEHHALGVRSAQRRAAARAELVDGASVVATTVAAAAALPSRRYDAVLVEGAAAVPLVEALLAVGSATTTAVLFGDFQRPGPRLPGNVRTVAITDPGIATWVAGTVFSHYGIDSAERAIDTEGCVAMLREFRGAPAPEVVPLPAPGVRH